MGTRGFFGFIYKGKCYVIYNHFDSYPEYLGKNIVNEIIFELYHDPEFVRWIGLIENLKIITNDMEPSDGDIKKLEQWTDLTVGGQGTHDWYCLLRKTQGSLNKVLESGYLENNAVNNGPPTQDIWLEFGYILDLDKRQFEYYDGSDKPTIYPLGKLPKWG
jgi:hypothetical protein